jgi:hypothetical protein
MRSWSTRRQYLFMLAVAIPCLLLIGGIILAFQVPDTGYRGTARAGATRIEFVGKPTGTLTGDARTMAHQACGKQADGSYHADVNGTLNGHVYTVSLVATTYQGPGNYQISNAQKVGVSLDDLGSHADPKNPDASDQRIVGGLGAAGSGGFTVDRGESSGQVDVSLYDLASALIPSRRSDPPVVTMHGTWACSA